MYMYKECSLMYIILSPSILRITLNSSEIEYLIRPKTQFLLPTRPNYLNTTQRPP